MSDEMWKDIPGYEGSYEASTDGRIRTKEGKTTISVRHGVRHWKSRVMKGRGDNQKTGRRVGLWLDGKCRDWLVARLVAITFLGVPCDRSMTVNHKDGNRLNNRIDNLEWLTLGDNIRHGFDNGLYPQRRICLTDEIGNGFICRSMSKAGEVIGRNRGYISHCVKNNKLATGINGIKYTITKV